MLTVQKDHDKKAFFTTKYIESKTARAKTLLTTRTCQLANGDKPVSLLTQKPSSYSKKWLAHHSLGSALGFPQAPTYQY